MHDRRPEADHRFTFHGSWKRAEYDADGRGSFAAVERSMSDRLLKVSPDRIEGSMRRCQRPYGSTPWPDC